MRKRGKIMAAILSGALLFGAMAPLTSVFAEEADENSVLIAESDIPLHLQYDEEAPYGNETLDREYNRADEANNKNDGWERWSIPLGNGYFGVNAFGRTETERLQITEKTLANPYYKTVTVNGESKIASLGGLNNFSETYLDFGHTNADVTDYRRALDLKTAISTVEYTYEGVRYTREYFVSYPDRAIVLRLTSSEAGKLSFTLRPTIPYEQDYAVAEGDGASKHGTVVAKAEGGIGEIVLSGNMGYFDIDFEANYRVIPDGGSVSAANGTDEDGNIDNGTVTVEGAKSALIVITLGTNYELTSDVFTSAQKDKIPDTNRSAHDKVTEDMQKILTRTASMDIDAMYEDLKKVHTDDYSALFGRVTLDLGTDASEVEMMTDELLAAYKNGSAGTYLETLYFQYGRYLLIASSRENSLPPNLQGAWSRYNFSPWGAGYWHNINEQMNYWPAFTTNLAETFESYVNYNKAYMAQAKKNADAVIRNSFSDQYGKDGGNGWCLGNGFPYEIGGNDSAGNIGFMTELFWDYYLFTQDKTLLEETVYPTLADAARFITKIMIVDEDGHYLVKRCDSPEQYVNGEWYYTSGTTYAQTFAYTNNYHTLLAAKILGKTGADDSILNTIAEQLDKYDPIKIGYSGQLKEFREEDYYGDLGEWKHRHVSQLVGLYPAYIVNGTTEAWLDAAKYSLTERGYSGTTGWGLAHRLNLWARTGDGDQTYRVLQNLLKESTATNLWDLHPPFQIDGNFGGTAGIAEMLLQSQAGYIEPLAAIPDAWTTGSYTGLVARGNFEVGAKWENGSAQTFNILSKVGGECSVSYANIKNAKVRTASGKTVSFKATGSNLITFDTTAGETYVISGLSAKERSAAVSSLEATYTATGSVTLTWGKVNDAVSYNIYKAVDSAPGYTFLANTSANAYTDRRATADMTVRATYAVTAINANGVESERALAYVVPSGTEAKIHTVSACIVENSELQVTVNATEAAAKYRLYSRASATEDWMLVTESGYPVLFDSAYNAAKTYGVSVINYFDGSESEITIVRDFGSESETTYTPANILEGKTFVPTAAALAAVHSADYGYERLTDGSMNLKTGRYSSKVSSNALFDATVSFGGVYLVSELRMYDFNPTTDSSLYAGKDMKIEISRLGAWTTVWEGTNAEILNHRTKDADGTLCLAFDLGVTEAESLRITVSSPIDGQSISLYEIRLSGIQLDDAVSMTEIDNVFHGKTFTQGTQGTKLKIGNYGKLTDHVYAYLSDSGAETSGDFGNRVHIDAPTTETPTVALDAVADLGTQTVLTELRLYYCYGNTGAHLTVNTENAGVWTTAKDMELTSATVSQITKYGKEKLKWLSVDLEGVTAEKIEIIISSETSQIIYYEFECSGAIYSTPIVGGENRELFAGKTFTKGSEATSIPAGSADYASLTDGTFALMNENWQETGGIFNRQVRTENYGAIDAVMDFGAPMILDQLRLYDVYPWSKGAPNAGSEIIVRVYNSGKWSEVRHLTLETNSSNVTYIDGTIVTAYRGTSGSRVDPVKNQWIEIDLGGVRAEQIEIICKGSKVVAFYEFEGYGRPATAESVGSNALAGLEEKNLTISVPTHNSGKYPASNAFDGDLSTRLAVADNLSDGYTLEIDLGVAKELYTLRIYDFKGGTVGGIAASRSNDTEILIYSEGVWVTVVKGAALDPTAPFTSFYLHGVKTSKLRIHFNNTQTFDDGNMPSASIYEISCTTGISSVDKKALVEAFKNLPELEAGAEGEVLADHIKVMKTFHAMLTDTEADDGTVAAYTARILDYAATADTHAYGAWETVKAASCHEKGIERRICTVHPDAEETREVFFATDDKALASDRLPDGYFNGKKIVTIGDSITYGYQWIDNAHSKVKSYGEWLSDLLGANVTNLGISGTVITKATYRTRNNTLTRENIAGADVVTVLLGANDWDCSFNYDGKVKNFDLGTFNSTDETTYCGAVRAWCEKIIEMKKTPEFANTKFVFMTPLVSSWANNSASDWDQSKQNPFGYTLRDYCEAILEICADYDIPVIDLNLYSGFYYNSAEDNNVEELIPDGIHPSADGQRFLADAVAEGLMNNMHYVAADGSARHAFRKTVIRPTSTATGYTELSCAACHSYHRVEGTPLTDDTLGTAKHVSLSLRGDIALNLYYEIPDETLKSRPSVAVEFIFADGSTCRISVKDAILTENGYRFVLPLNAAQMSEIVEYHLVYGKASGSYGKTSVRGYCDAIFADASAEEKNPGIGNLLRAMLNYGSYAQLRFGYRTDDLAAAGLYTDATDPVKNTAVTVTSAPKVTGSLDGVSLLGYTLALDSETALRIALKVDDSTKYTFTVKGPDGNVTALSPEKFDDYIVLTIAEICASGLSANYTLTVQANGGKTMSVSMDALCYVSSVLSGTGEEETLTDVVRALKLYGDAAKAYIQ